MTPSFSDDSYRSSPSCAICLSFLFRASGRLAPALHAGSASSGSRSAAHVHYTTPTPSFVDEEPGMTTAPSSDPSSLPTSARAASSSCSTLSSSTAASASSLSNHLNALVAARALMRDSIDDTRSCGSEGGNSPAAMLGSPLS